MKILVCIVFKSILELSARACVCLSLWIKLNELCVCQVFFLSYSLANFIHFLHVHAFSLLFSFTFDYSKVHEIINARACVECERGSSFTALYCVSELESINLLLCHIINASSLSIHTKPNQTKHPFIGGGYGIEWSLVVVMSINIYMLMYI